MLVRTSAASGLAGLLLLAAAVPSAAEDIVIVDTLRGGSGSADVVLNPRDASADGGASGQVHRATQVGRASTTERTCTHMGEPIDCTSSFGVWSHDLQCWVQRMSPQPDADDRLWAGRTDGAIYWCQPPSIAGAIGGGHACWAPSAGAAGAPILADPVTLAEEAIDSMNLRAITIGVTPPEGPGSYTLLGIPTWMWVEDPTPRTWGPIRRSASAGAVTVSADARVTKVVWDMGDGTVVSCGTGTPYDEGFGEDPSPDCGHRYRAPGRYQVSATSYWVVDWAGAGQSGTIRFTLRRDASVWVREALGLISRQG